MAFLETNPHFPTATHPKAPDRPYDPSVSPFWHKSLWLAKKHMQTVSNGRQTIIASS